MVTGAASGIGQAVALLYALEGARVALLDHNRVGLADTLAQIAAAGGEALSLECDVSDEVQVQHSVAAITRAWGGLDVGVGVAGIELAGFGDAQVHELELEVWQRTIDTNLTGMFLTCKHAVRALLAGGGGSIIVTGSPCGSYGACAAEHAYSASKAGTHGLVRVMAVDYARSGIRVNAVIPGFIDTPLNAGIMANPAMVADLVRSIPAGRPGRVTDVAPLYLWLASDEAAYVTGAFFTADGGQTAI